MVVRTTTAFLWKNGNPEKYFPMKNFLPLQKLVSEGALEADERERIENVLEFGETVAEEVMTPRPEMDVLSDDTTLEEAIRFFWKKHIVVFPYFLKPSIILRVLSHSKIFSNMSRVSTACRIARSSKIQFSQFREYAA